MARPGADSEISGPLIFPLSHVGPRDSNAVASGGSR